MTNLRSINRSQRAEYSAAFVSYGKMPAGKVWEWPKGGGSLSEEAHAARMELLFTRHIRDLRRFLGYYLTNQNDIDDCVQETFLSVWRQEVRGALREDVRGYLFTTAKNVVRMLRRKNNARATQHHEPLSEDVDNVANIEAEAGLVFRESIRRIETELQHLQPATRKVFLLCHGEDLPYEKIAQRLGISVRTVEREMARALEHLRSTLGDSLQDILG